ncbi:hypothetical protein GQ44DRAFT_825610 [Phaeosphaeriaceae sp. PMI808]|nr:hypothetical protein GQ44DRAFT_825610 [Phaeosphaeriaceae sp. PMI808]
MSDIYSNADLVISAAAARDSSESFFVAWNPLAVNPCLIGVYDSTAKGGVVPGLLGGIYALPPRKYADGAMDEINLSRLASRGWFFQEERLAQRTLFFTNHQIILQCNNCHTRVKELDWESVASWSRSRRYDLMRPDIAAECWQLIAAFPPQHYFRRRRPIKSGGVVRLYGKVQLASWRIALLGEPQEYYIGHQHTRDLDDPHYHQQFLPVSADPADGPDAHVLCGTGGKRIGYFVPDTNEDLPDSGEDGIGEATRPLPSKKPTAFKLSFVQKTI